MKRLSPIGAISRGVVAGAIGTVAMDLLWYRRYRRGGGEDSFPVWELTTDLSSWEGAPAPALIGKRLLEALSRRDIPERDAGLVNDVMHWSYGLFWGAQYGIVARAGAAPRPLRTGIAFGSAVWASDYVVLPLAKVYKPIWEYDSKSLLEDLSAHVVFGVGAATAFQLLAAV